MLLSVLTMPVQVVVVSLLMSAVATVGTTTRRCTSNEGLARVHVYVDGTIVTVEQDSDSRSRHHDRRAAAHGRQLPRRGYSIGQPFGTIVEARDELRRLRQQSPCSLRSGATVHLREGAHYLTEPLILGPGDSGWSAAAPIVYRAYADESVLISGGLPIPLSMFTPAPAPAFQAGVLVLQANLTELLHTRDFGELRTGGADGPPVATDVAELFFGGKPMHLARWPDVYPNGSTQWAYTGTGVPAKCTTDCTGFEVRNGSEGRGPQGPLAPSSLQLQRWNQEALSNYPYLHGYWQWDWRDTYTPLQGTSLPAATDAGVLRVADPSLLSKANLGARYYAVNLQAELTAPGEYYIERSNRTRASQASYGMLYFCPPLEPSAYQVQRHRRSISRLNRNDDADRYNAAGLGAVDSLAQVPVAHLSMATSLISLREGAAFLTFQGLRFEHCRGAAIDSSSISSANHAMDGVPRGSSHHTHHITLDNCTIANTGGGGDSRRGGAIDLTGTHNTINECTVYGIAGTAISLRGGNHVNLTRGENTLSHTYIHHTARWFRTYHPAVAWAGVGNTFSHNRIMHLPHAAFFGGGNAAVCTTGWVGKPAWWPNDRGVCGANDNVFHSNWIEGVGHECVDTGAFYTCGQGGTGRINLNNSLVNNTFKSIRNRGVQFWRNATGHAVGSGAVDVVPSLGVGGPFVQGVYLDDGMSGWWASDNTFDDVQNAILINGGTQNVATRNRISNVDYAVWLSVEYSDQLTYDRLCNVSKLHAWQKYRNFGGAAPRRATNWGLSQYGSYAMFHQESARSKDNLVQNNSYCRASHGFCECCVGSDSSPFVNNSNASFAGCHWR